MTNLAEPQTESNPGAVDAGIGARLRAVRAAYGLSQRELARRAGVTHGTISLIETERVSPSVSSLKKVLDGIPMSLAEFFTLDTGERTLTVEIDRMRTMLRDAFFADESP